MTKDDSHQQKRQKKTKNIPKEPTPQATVAAKTPIIPEEPNINPENCLVPMFPEEDETTNNSVIAPVSTQHSNVINQMRQALHMFQNASFTNCNFTS